MTRLLFYVRHGDPIYNPDSLTEQGLLQAQALVERMKICKPERIFASSSNRAQLTAKPTAEALGLPIETLDWCHEHKTWEDFTTTREDGVIKWYCHIPSMWSYSIRTKYTHWVRTGGSILPSGIPE